MVKEKVAAPTAATQEESLGGNCPKFVGLPGADDANPKFQRWAAGANNDECECPPLETRATNPARQLSPGSSLHLGSPRARRLPALSLREELPRGILPRGEVPVHHRPRAGAGGGGGAARRAGRARGAPARGA